MADLGVEVSDQIGGASGRGGVEIAVGAVALDKRGEGGEQGRERGTINAVQFHAFMQQIMILKEYPPWDLERHRDEDDTEALSA